MSVSELLIEEKDFYSIGLFDSHKGNFPSSLFLLAHQVPSLGLRIVVLILLCHCPVQG